MDPRGDGLAPGQGLTFSFRSASLTGRATVLGGGGGTEVSAIVTCGTVRQKREHDQSLLQSFACGLTSHGDVD